MGWQGGSEAFGVTNSRGLALIGQGKWLEALKLFTSSAQVGDSAALTGLCRAMLRVQVGPATSAEPTITLGPAHPAQHLADSINAVQRAAVMKDAAGSHKSKAQATGAALAFLMHPNSAQMPTSLVSLAFDQLASNAGWFSDDPVAPVPGSTAPRVWEERAKKTATFRSLLDLTGLYPVKGAMSNLADQVWRAMPSPHSRVHHRNSRILEARWSWTASANAICRS